MAQRVIDLEGFVHIKTEKAVLFSTDGVKANAAWLPLSQIECEDDEGPTEIVIPEWLAQERGLI